MRPRIAVLLVTLAACSKQEPSLPLEKAPFKDGLFLDYAPTAGEGLVRASLKPAGAGWTLTCKDEDESWTAGLDANGVAGDGALAPAKPLQHGSEGGPPIWIPSGRRSMGATAWILRLKAESLYGGEEPAPQPVVIAAEQDLDGRPSLLAEFKSGGLAQAFQFTIRAFYDKQTGYLLRYEYSPFTGGGSGWKLAATNAW
jgi:hypothetical protein